MSNQCKDCEHWIITQKGYCTPQHIDNVDGDDGCPSWKERKDIQPQPDEDLVEDLIMAQIQSRILIEDIELLKTLRAEIRTLLQQRQPKIDIKRLAHLLYISISPTSPNLSYSVLTKAFEERLNGELGKQPEKPKISGLELDNFASSLEILVKDGCDINIALRGMFQSKGVKVAEK